MDVSPPSGPRIAVLGAGGFLGSHLVPALLGRHGATIEAVDLCLDKLEVASERVVRTRASIADRALLAGVVRRSDLVLSLTALCNPALYNTRPVEVIDASYDHLVPLCELCAESGAWLVHFSTCEVYGRVALDGDGAPMAAMHERDSALVLGPVDRERWTYACAKQLLERRIWAMGRHGGLRFTIVRPFNVIGPRMDFIPGVDGEGVPRVLACFMHALLTGEPLPLVDGGTRRRSFVAVTDFVEAVLRIAERPEASLGEIFNVGNPANDVSIAELAALLGRAWAAQVPDARGFSTRVVSSADFYGEGYDDTPARIPDIGKARRLLDWEPRLGLAEALPPIVEDYVRRYRRAPGAGEKA